MKAIVGGKLVFPERIIEGNLLIEDGRIVACGRIDVPKDAQIIDAEGLYVGPGLIDQHSHGYQHCLEGISVNEDPGAAARSHLLHGTTSYVPSSDYGDPEAVQLEMIRRCIREITQNPDTSIVGIHLEGPYINKKYGSCPDHALEYSDEVCERFFSLAAPYVLQCTYAPELPSAPRLEEKMRSYRIHPAIGHSEAGEADIERAAANGANVITHLFDATGNYRGVAESAKRTQHPQECTSDIALSIPGMYYELICDAKGLHVSNANVNLAFRAAGEDHIILISDAFVEPSDGMGKNLDPSNDVNYDFRGTLSGSRLTVARAAQNFRKATGADIRVTFKCAATNAAKALGLYGRVGSIEPGRMANLVFVDEDFRVRKVFFKGNEIEAARSEG